MKNISEYIPMGLGLMSDINGNIIKVASEKCCEHCNKKVATKEEQQAHLCYDCFNKYYKTSEPR